MSDPNLSPPPNPIANAISEIKGWLPWAKVTAPMIPTIFVPWYVGNLLKELYIFNVQNHVVGGFPTPNVWLAYFISALFIICSYTGLAAWHLKRNMTRIK